MPTSTGATSRKERVKAALEGFSPSEAAAAQRINNRLSVIQGIYTSRPYGYIALVIGSIVVTALAEIDFSIAFVVGVMGIAFVMHLTFRQEVNGRISSLSDIVGPNERDILRTLCDAYQRPYLTMARLAP
ncbi:hypothetical protein HON52_00860 [Candidatus Uhrbacteria bacterium]|jgi:hypothetical protein|nr:hypothetical protein [Candidatus Uhrbacteria bacterium]